MTNIKRWSLGAERSNLKKIEVVHKAFVEVNDKGTESAASTAVVMTKSAAMPTLFIADHQFMFVIRENSIGSIVFIARVENPQK
jgi:serpin B